MYSNKYKSLKLYYIFSHTYINSSPHTYNTQQQEPEDVGPATLDAESSEQPLPPWSFPILPRNVRRYLHTRLLACVAHSVLLGRAMGERTRFPEIYSRMSLRRATPLRLPRALWVHADCSAPHHRPPHPCPLGSVVPHRV